MLELALAGGTCFVMAKIAEADDESATVWGGITFLLCLISFFVIPFPFLRIMGVAVLAFILMFAVKAVRGR